LRQERPDLFFTPAHVIPFSYFGPAVATIHDLGYRIFPETHPRSQRLYLEWSTLHNARRSRKVLADSQATREDLSRFYGIDAQKVQVVYPGVDPTLGPVTDEGALAAVRTEYGLPPSYLLYLGTLQPRKNLARLVQAYAESGVAPDLVLAGKAGWLSRPILDTISALPSFVSRKIHLPGFIADEDKAALLSGATALLYPSLYEGFGFPILEAQACATPVLTAANSSLPEVAGEGALLVEAENTEMIASGIRRIVGDQALRSTLVARGLANVRRFTWEQAAQETLKVFEKAVG
jgi:glycosyltransferase involved in cell wall biosynthesis